jgi:hypothetical protein
MLYYKNIVIKFIVDLNNQATNPPNVGPVPKNHTCEFPLIRLKHLVR